VFLLCMRLLSREYRLQKYHEKQRPHSRRTELL